jgi:hypothetical protein
MEKKAAPIAVGTIPKMKGGVVPKPPSKGPQPAPPQKGK